MRETFQRSFQKADSRPGAPRCSLSAHGRGAPVYPRGPCTCGTEHVDASACERMYMRACPQAAPSGCGLGACWWGEWQGARSVTGAASPGVGGPRGAPASPAAPRALR